MQWTAKRLLDIPELSNAKFAACQARMRELQKDLSRKIELAESASARIGDILAVKSYRQLKR